MRTNLAYATYSQNNASIESSEKLIKMLYEGILRFTALAKRSIEEKNIEKKDDSLFGIWKDKEDNVDDIVRNMRKGRDFDI